MRSRLFSLIRPPYEDEPEVDLASAETRNNAELSAALERQIAFDNEVVDQLRALKLNDAQIAKLENTLGDDDARPTAPTDPPPVVPAPVGTHVLGAGGPATVSQSVEQSRPDPEPQTLREENENEKQKRADKKKEEEEEEQEEQSRARPLTIFFAIGVGLIATICLVAYLVWDQMNSFKGADRITELLDSANGLTGDEFEAVQTTTDALKDWFLLKNEHFAVPKEFGPTRTIACRVFQFHNADVGQVMAKDNRELLYFLFDPAALGVKPHEGKWEIVEGEKLVGGVTQVEDTGFVVAFRGKRDEMQAYLATKAPGKQ